MAAQVAEYTISQPFSLLLHSKPSTLGVEATSPFESKDRKILSQLAAILDDGYVFKSSNLDLGGLDINTAHQAGKGAYMDNDNTIAFQERSTGRILVVEGLEKEHEFNSTLYDRDMEVIGGRKISTLFDRGGRSELAKACDTAMELHSVEKTDVFILDWPDTSTAPKPVKGVYMSNEFAQLEDQYLEQMANGGASGRALEADYLEREANDQEQESRREAGNLYSHGEATDSRLKGDRKPYYQQQAESLLEAVKSGRAPFLPQEPVMDESGTVRYSGNYTQEGEKIVITPRPAVRMLSGNVLTGVNQLTAQVELDKAGRKSQTLLTFEQASKEGLRIRQGARSFVLTEYDKDAGEGQSKARVYHVFAAGDVTDSRAIQGALAKNANANAPKPWTREVLACRDGTPEKFLGTYLAASSTGARFETDRATVRQFQQQFTQMMEKSIGEKQHTAIFEVGRNAQKYASAIRENGYKQWEKAHNQEKEQNVRSLQQRARGMEIGL